MLIVAGPGSGKTFTLTERIVNIILTKEVQPENILISTFTEKAAKEILTRISNKILEHDLKLNVNDFYTGTLPIDEMQEYYQSEPYFNSGDYTHIVIEEVSYE